MIEQICLSINEKPIWKRDFHSLSQKIKFTADMIELYLDDVIISFVDKTTPFGKRNIQTQMRSRPSYWHFFAYDFESEKINNFLLHFRIELVFSFGNIKRPAIVWVDSFKLKTFRIEHSFFIKSVNVCKHFSIAVNSICFCVTWAKETFTITKS